MPTLFASANPHKAGALACIELSGLSVPDLDNPTFGSIGVSEIIVHASGSGPYILHHQLIIGDHFTEKREDEIEPERIQSIRGPSFNIEGSLDDVKLRLWAQFPDGEVIGITGAKVVVGIAGAAGGEPPPQPPAFDGTLPVPTVKVDQAQHSPVQIDVGKVMVTWFTPPVAIEGMTFEVSRKVGDGPWLPNGKTDKHHQRDPVFEQVPIAYRVRAVLDKTVGEWSEPAISTNHLIEEQVDEQ